MERLKFGIILRGNIETSDRSLLFILLEKIGTLFEWNKSGCVVVIIVSHENRNTGFTEIF